MRRVTWYLVTVAVLMASWPAAAQFADGSPPAVTEEERRLQEAAKGKQFPIGAGVSLSQSIGAGSFTSDRYLRRASYDVSLSLSPYWRITPMLQLGLGMAVSQSLVENYDSSVTMKNRMLLSDLSMSLSHAQLWTIPGVGIGIGGSLSASAPTSLQSQYRGLYTSLRAGLNLSRSLGPVYLGYGFSFFKNFNRYTMAALDTSRVGNHVVLAHYLGNEQLSSDLVAAGGNNTSFGLANSLLASWSITERFGLAAMYSLSHSWTYEAYALDELSGVYATEGRGLRDGQSGVVNLSYSVSDNLSLSAGVQTMVAPKTANNKDYIFPFLNFSNNQRNNTGIYMSLDARF